MDKGDLVDYINSSLKRGIPIEEIKQQLMSRSFSDYDINEAISQSNYKEHSEKEEVKKEKKRVESIEGWDKDLPKE